MKRQLRYPATVAFRTTEYVKIVLERRAMEEGMSVSEILHKIVLKYLDQDFMSEFSELVYQLALIRGKDLDFVKKRIELHYDWLVQDAHHGYTEQSALTDIKYEIQICKDHYKGETC